MIFKISNYTLQLDWGAFIIAGAATGKSPVSPLKDVPDSDAYAAILYAGIARHAEANGQVAEISYEGAKELIKSFAPVQIGKIDAAWLECTTVNPDEKFPVKEETKKKK